MSEHLPLIACSLDAREQKARIEEWADMLATATGREELSSGVRYSFPADGGLESRLRALAAAEQTCCSFMAFDIARVGEAVEMTVSAPSEGLEALRFVFAPTL
jgi:MerR family copper efflux transcriptional regulator